MDQTKVMEMFCVLCGEEENETGALFVLQAIGVVTANLKDASLLDTYGDGLCYFAACLAYYYFSLSKAGSSVQSFSAGDFSVSSDKGSQIEAAKELLLNAKVSVSALLCDNDFIFSVIEGE
jgi:hypothetical protein